MTMPRSFVDVEMPDGAIHENIRVTFADKRAWEKTARARGWDPERDQVTLAGFLAWAALTRCQLIPADTKYTDFADTVVDVVMHQGDPTDPDRELDEDQPGDPTQPAQ